MRGVNKVILVGTLGRDPETKTFPNGGSLTQFSIATSEVWTDKTSGERKEQTEWHRIELWDGLANIAEQYLRKGNSVYVEGRIRTEEYVDKDGITRRGIRIRGTSMTLVGGGNRDNAASGDGSTQMAAPAPARPNPAPVTPPPPAFDAGGDSDDLPF